MTKNLTDAPETFPVQTSPVAGEPRTAGSVEGPFQKAANRTAYLLDRHNHIDPTKEGVRRLRRFTDFTAMRATVDVPDKTVAQVDGRGLFQFEGAAVNDELEPFIIRPDSVLSTAPGRWVMNFYATLGAANGIARLDANGRVATSDLAAAGGGSKIQSESVQNGLVTIRTVVSIGTSPTTSTDWQDVFEAAFELTMKKGDIATAIGRFSRSFTTATSNVHHDIRWAVNGLSSTLLASSDETVLSPVQARKLTETIAWSFIAPADGDYVFQLQQASPDAVEVTVSKFMVTALHFRP